MAKKAFVAGETNKSQAIRDAIQAIGGSADNDAVKTYISENWNGFGWSSNPAADIAAARKALAKADGQPVKRGRRKGAKIRKKVAVRKGAVASAPSQSPLILALQFLASTPDADAVLKKARMLVSAVGSPTKAIDVVKAL